MYSKASNLEQLTNKEALTVLCSVVKRLEHEKSVGGDVSVFLPTF